MFYLYFVLPPVIIVVSLALIIFLISRKMLDIENKIAESKDNLDGESQLSMEVKSRGLYILEKSAHWFKIFSLKMHNWIERKLKFIKERKTKIDLNKKNNGKNKNGKEEKATNNFDKAVDLKNKKMIGRIFKYKIKRETKPEMADGVDYEEKKEDNQRIMVSDKVTYPEERKEELENVLIERIAKDPRDIEAYERLGDYYVSQKNSKDAKECYRQVLKLNPRSINVRGKLEKLSR